VRFVRKPKCTGMLVGWRKMLPPCMNHTYNPEGRGLVSLIAALACLERPAAQFVLH